MRSGKAKRIAWVMGEGIRASWDLELDEFPGANAVDANALKAVFSAGVDKFLIDIYTGEYDVTLVEERLGELLQHSTDPELLRKV